MILTVTLNAAVDKRYVIKNVQVGQVNRVSECVYSPGGKGLNVSKVLSVAGEPVTATGFIGGHAGDYIAEQLKPFGVEADFYRLEAESRSCLNIWDEENRVQTEILEPGFTVSPDEFEGFKVKFKKLVKKADVVAMSGSVPKGLDTSVYEELVAIAKDEQKKVILDTSGDYLVQGIQAKPTLIKPNIDEIRMLTGKQCDKREDVLAAAEQIHDSGVAVVVISLGADGSLVVCDEGVYQAMVPKIDAVNTVGCGDSMIGGFAMGLARDLSIEETLRMASAISAASALREETGIFAVEDMEHLLPQIQIIKLK
ncbi:MAG: 1-phosphofructokinase [Lachnospiraceae bacterium]|nr:1-phosphofructokinase [Lachnospiraceae bacterium]